MTLRIPGICLAVSSRHGLYAVDVEILHRLVLQLWRTSLAKRPRPWKDTPWPRINVFFS